MSSKMLIRRTLHEMSGILIVWTTCLKAQLAWHESCELINKNDLPDGDNTLYTKHGILWQGHLTDYSPLAIWWVFETESEFKCGIIAWAVTKSRQDDRQQHTFEGRIQRKKILKKKHWIKKRRQVDSQWSCIWALASAVQRSGSVQWETETNVRQTDT